MNISVVSYFDVVDGDWECHPSWHPNTRKMTTRFIKGALYRMKQKVRNIDSSISFDIPEPKTYRCKGIIHSFNGMNIESIVMKQESGPTVAHKYSLSKSQCEQFHIKFEHGLELFKLDEKKFQRIVERFPNNKELVLNPDDMSTYPHCYYDGSIRQILIKLHDFRFVSETKIKNTKTRKTYKIIDNEGLRTIGGINVYTDTFLKTPNDKIVYKPNELCSYRIVNPENLKKDYRNNVFIELLFGQSSEGMFTEDGYIGIHKTKLKNKKITDIVSFKDIKS